MSEQPKVVSVRVFQDLQGEYRWSAHAANGEPVASSGEGYVNHVDALAAAASLFPEASVEDESV